MGDWAEEAPLESESALSGKEPLRGLRFGGTFGAEPSFAVSASPLPSLGCLLGDTSLLGLIPVGTGGACPLGANFVDTGLVASTCGACFSYKVAIAVTGTLDEFASNGLFGVGTASPGGGGAW